MGNMDEKTVSFEEKLMGLLEQAKKKKNVLENREILDYFKGEILGPDKLDKISQMAVLFFSNRCFQ